jgi:hypothetical protein
MSHRPATIMFLSLATHGYLRRQGDRVDQSGPSDGPCSFGPAGPDAATETDDSGTGVGTEAKTGDSDGNPSPSEMGIGAQVWK